MIERTSDLRYYILADLHNRGRYHVVRAFMFDPISRFTILLRLNEYLCNNGVPLLLRAAFVLWYRRLSLRLGFSIPFNVLGPGVAIVHYGLLVINPASRIGRNCRIHAGVNIGGSGPLGSDEMVESCSPLIGDNVYIGPGAKLFGPIEIGNDCVIGANAVVNKSFPESGVTIAGVPARIVKRSGSAGRLRQYHGGLDRRY